MNIRYSCFYLVWTLFLLFTFTAQAQLRLDVAGDAKINGKLNLDSGNENVFIGFEAGLNNTNAGDDENVFIGYQAGRASNSGTGENTFIGYKAGEDNTTGFGNVFLGRIAGGNAETTTNCILIGILAAPDLESGNGNIILGRQSGSGLTSGNSNTLIGRNTKMSNGKENTGLGADFEIYGEFNTAIGAFSEVGERVFNEITFEDDIFPQNKAIAIGYRAQALCSNCAVIGGIGNHSVKVGIGTNAPKAPLDVNGEVRISNANIPMGLTTEVGGNSPILNMDINFRQADKNTTFRGAAFRIDSRNGNPLFQWLKRSAGSSNDEILMTLEESGNFNVNGDIFQNGSLIHSDKRYKKNIRPIKNPLSLLQKINGVSYEFRTKDFEARSFAPAKHLGLIAQEVEKVFPELVKENSDGYKAVNYDGLIPVLIQGMKAQQEIIDQQEQKNGNLAKKVDNLEKEVGKLQALVEKLITNNTNNTPGNSYLLPLRQQAKLAQNQPNPFDQNTLVEFFIPDNVQNAKIQVTAIDGKILDTLQIPEKGKGEVQIKANSYPAGTYYYSLILDGQVLETKRMVLTR